MAGHVEGEAVVLDGPAPASNPVGLLEQQRVFTEMIGGAEPGRAGADDNMVMTKKRILYAEAACLACTFQLRRARGLELELMQPAHRPE